MAALLKEIESILFFRILRYGNSRTNTLSKPSILAAAHPAYVLRTKYKALFKKFDLHFTVSPHAEITLEANPDDITEEKLKDWKEAGINRLSIGIQSFFEEDLQWMNRAHNAQQAIDSLQLAVEQF